MARDPEDIIKVFPLISAWGRMIEAGNPADAELDALKALQAQDGALLRDAVACARFYQKQLIGTPQYAATPIDDPAHPRQRHARVMKLEQLLGIEEEEYSL